MSGPRDLDYWSFVELAQKRLNSKFGEHHRSATEVMNAHALAEVETNYAGDGDGDLTVR